MVAVDMVSMKEGRGMASAFSSFFQRGPGPLVSLRFLQLFDPSRPHHRPAER